jgi:hypothetical protein
VETSNLTEYQPAGHGIGDVMSFLLGMNWDFISQTTAFFNVTEVKTSNLTCTNFFILSKISLKFRSIWQIFKTGMIL